MEKEYKIVPFDIEKAKSGAKVITRKDKLKVEILKYNLKDECPIIAIINFDSGSQSVHSYYQNGRYFKKEINDLDLMIKEEVKFRRMTNQELSWWLRDCPEEHREMKYKKDGWTYCYFTYEEKYVNKECSENISIRSNGEEWREPLIEIND